MDVKIIKIGDELLSLTTAEAIELQKYLESKGLVIQQSATAVVVEKEKEPEEVKESENVNLVLVRSGSIIKLAKALTPITGKTAMEVKKLHDAIPAKVFEGIPRSKGLALLSELSNAEGATEFEFKLEDC